VTKPLARLRTALIAKDKRGEGHSNRRPQPFLLAYSLVLLTGLFGAVIAYIALILLIPGAKKNSLDTAKTALTVIAGCGAGAALFVSYRKQRVDELNSHREQDKLFTERYTQAVAQLGNLVPAIRLGGIYALLRIADDSERDRPTCLTLLCAYVRTPVDAEKIEASEANVREAAIRGISERLAPSHAGFWKNADVDLTGITFSTLTLDKVTAYQISLRGANIKHLEIRNSNFTIMDLDDIVVSKSFRMNDVKVSSLCDFRRAQLRNTDIDDCLFPTGRYAYGLNFYSANFRGEDTSIGIKELKGGILLNKATIEGPVTIWGEQQSGTVDSISFDEATINGKLTLTGLDISEKVSFEGSTIRGELLLGDADDAYTDGTIDWNGITVRGDINFTGATVSTPSVSLEYCSYSTLQLPNGWAINPETKTAFAENPTTQPPKKRAPRKPRTTEKRASANETENSGP